jgi:hypothetical protein
MRGEPVFLGVYAKEGMGNSARRWYAWGLPDGNFMLQEIDRNNQGRPKNSPSGSKLEQNIQRLEPSDFFAEYRVFSTASSKQRPDFIEAPVHNQKQTAQDVPLRPEQGSASNSGKYGANPGSARFNAPPKASIDSINPEAHGQHRLPVNNSGFVNLWQTEPDSPKTGPSRQYELPAADSGAYTKMQSRRRGPGHPAQTTDGDGDPYKDAGQTTDGYGDPYGDTAPKQGNGTDYTIVKGQQGAAVPDPDRRQEQFTPGADARPKYSQAEHNAKIEEKFRTEFSMALIRLKNKRTEALQALDNLAKSRGPFNEEHKFMFTDCGLALRKRNLYVLANQFHQKARELSPDDEHVLFNLARVMYESGKIDKAREYLRLSLKISPDFAEGKDFLAFIDGADIS